MKSTANTVLKAEEKAMDGYDWGIRDAKQLTYQLLPQIVELAKMQGVLSAVDRKGWEANSDGQQERCALALAQLVICKQDGCPTEQEVLDSLPYGQIKAFYESISAGTNPSPLSMFETTTDEMRSFKPVLLGLDSRLTLPKNMVGALATSWRLTPQIGELKWLQSACWFCTVLGIHELSEAERLLLAVVGVKGLLHGDWLLHDCCFEQELLKRRGQVRSLFAGNYPNDERYLQAAGVLLDVLIDSVHERAGKCEPVDSAPSENDVKREPTLSLSSTEIQMLGLLRENPKMTHKDLKDRLGISERDSQRKAGHLKELGLLSRKGSTRVGSWVVNLEERSDPD